ncbi:biotin transporter BioY [Ornithinibacillus halotolerans]|uniref:Biotin transporter n=1 Tax=Ornithinibacillus halotolerans TaxID=1274357 RepID=A0A916W8R3_9BACI|nr:biotin transporter BioY [Ornithinibacillus halotolerans]GGA76603.1 BioY family transporter [Ornithinibacillus halotolerans]
MKNIKPIEITIGALFVCLMAIGANITVWFPFLAIPIGGATVPISLQTFFSILAGLILGKRLGSFAMITYVFVGVIGVPVFAGMKAGPMQLITPTSGFIFSFIVVAFVVGWIAEQKNSSSLSLNIFASIIGLIINYVMGVSFMYLSMNTWLNLEIGYITAWAGMVPFFIKDLALSGLAAIFSIRIVKQIPMKWKMAKVS